MSARVVTAVFVRRDSIYKTLPDVDCWDEARDARNWPGGTPVIAHPPCAQWGPLSHLAKPAPHLKALAPLAVDWVREFGGVLEHPYPSKLWKACDLPAPGQRDRFGGWTLVMPQKWFGHKAEKATQLYIVGCEPRDIPPFPFVMGDAKYIVAGSGPLSRDIARRRHQASLSAYRPSITKAEREHTPPQFATWLVDLARRCGKRTQADFGVHARNRVQHSA
jgi:hypothetical protein